MAAGRHERAFWAGLTVASLLLGGYWTWRAPAGSWENYIFNFDLWIENDPGGWYIPAAHDLVVQPDRISFAGHPGLPLTLLLSAQQLALYNLARLAGTGLDFTTFIARNTPTVWVTAKLGMVLLHVASFVALYHFAKGMLRRRDLAIVAVGMYATSFPVLYYLTRVSVEPLLVAFFLATMVCINRAEDPSRRRVWLWSALAGACATSAFFTKISIMAPWPLLAAVWLAAGTNRGEPSLPGRRWTRLLAFAGGTAVSGALYSIVMDWPAFVRTWSGEGLRPVDPTMPSFLWRMPLEVITGFVRVLGEGSIDVLPAATCAGFFSFFEFLFFLAALWGLFHGFRHGAFRRGMVLWVLAYCAIVVCVWWYRAGVKDLHGFHYLFPVVAALSPVAALGIASLVPQVADTAGPALHRALAAGVVVAAVHYTGFFAVVDSKRQDHAAFSKLRASYYSAALRRAAPGERIAVIGGSAAAYHGLSDSYALPGRKSPLVKSLRDAFFEWVPPVRCDGFVRRSRQRGVGVVVDFALPDPGPRSLDEWIALPETGRCLPAPGPL